MFFVYILFSHTDRKLYVGFTKDIDRRIEQHALGLVESTKYRRPLELIYYEMYRNELEALRREKYLKGGNGREQLKKQLDLSLRSRKYRHLD